MTPDDLTPDPETAATDAADDAHTERWREERARGRVAAQPIVVEPDWRLACEWLVARNVFFAAQSTPDEYWYAAGSDDLLDLIARVRADERDRAAGRVEGLPSYDRVSTNGYLNGDEMVAPSDGAGDWLDRDDALAAIREGGA